MVLDLIGTWFGLGLGVFGTKGLGTGLDKIQNVLTISFCFINKRQAILPAKRHCRNYYAFKPRIILLYCYTEKLVLKKDVFFISLGSFAWQSSMVDLGVLAECDSFVMSHYPSEWSQQQVCLDIPCSI